jgi:hypothetical protein
MEADFHNSEIVWVGKGMREMERGAGLQGLVDEGLVSETEMMGALVLGGERVASYSKKFT